MRAHKSSGWLMKSLFRVLLWVLGTGLQLACRFSNKFRLQLTRELTIQVGSSDGVFHHYSFAPRSVKSRPGQVGSPTLNLVFCNAQLGFATLISPHACGKIVQALLQRRAEYEGDAVLLLWFFALTRFVLPIGKTGPLKVELPHAYIAPSDTIKVAGQTVREPAVNELDPAWRQAHDRRSQMTMLRVAAGEPVLPW